MASGELQTIETRIPARLDRLPWVRFHWLVVIGLGTVWILDGLEVTIVGSIAARLTEKESGIALTSSQVLTAGSIYVAGACVGALFFGQLTDRFGRKKLFLVTLLLYLVATVATAFAGSALYFFIARFFTGAGIGGEYAAINSAIDELIPARVRGRVDLIINGSYWLGAAGGAVGALVLLDTSIFAPDLGWRLAFVLGAVLGIAILLVRRYVPESPRWLFIHGHDEEAERIVGEIEEDVRRETDEPLDEPGDSITVRQRKTISFRTIASTAFKTYPKRTALGLALFVGQAFIYNAVTFGLGTFLAEFYDIDSGRVPLYIALFAFSNFLGPLLLGRLFDTVGRKPMITLTYLGSAAVLTVLTILFVGGSLGLWGFMALLLATFFLASAGASSAYLTVSEIFPMETRALAIAFFYAIGTAIGGITGPFLFGKMIESGEESQVGDRVLHRRRRDGAGWDHRDVHRRQGRGRGSRGHRQAAHRRGGGGEATPTSPAPGAGDRALVTGHVGLPAARPAETCAARSRQSSARSPTVTGRPSGAISRASSARASGGLAASAPPCARRSSPAARSAPAGTATSGPSHPARTRQLRLGREAGEPSGAVREPCRVSPGNRP